MLYLIVTSSYHILDREIQKIMGDSSYEVFDFTKIETKDLIEEFGYTDLFGSEKRIIVKNATCFETKGTGDSDLILKYLENPNPLTTIIFSCSNVDGKKKIVKLMKDKYHFIDFKTMYPKDMASMLLDLAKKDNYTMSMDDAMYIVNSSLNQYDIAYNTLEKIKLYYSNPCKIEHSVVTELCSHTIEENNFKLVDAIISDKLDIATSLLKDFELQKVEPTIFVSLLAREYRMMLSLMELAKQGKKHTEIMSLLGIQDWQLTKLNKETSSYTKKEVEDKLISLTKLDYEMKTSNTDKYRLLYFYLLK